MKFYNTLTRKLEEFVPLEENHVRMYTCGPTVYDYAHIGNFRAYVFEDLLRRYLKYSGYTVTQVMNLTDVDDKTIKGSRETGVSLDKYTRRYKDAFFEDLKKINIEPAEYYPAATEHVPEMIALIQKLFDNGYAYHSDDGSVYFNISRFKHYGRLARLDISGLRAGARVAQDEYDKENAADFALWKAWDEQDGEVAWDSPWGRGRPGWHIECSAMSMKYLEKSFDLHTGGVDNIFPHHEDEIAQSEGATSKRFVNYWLHCAHLIVDGQKMSKSLGNFYTLRDILDRGYSGREIRYVLTSAQYRQSLNFTFNALEAARASLARLDEFRDRLLSVVSCQLSDNGLSQLPKWAKKAREGFKNAMDNDLNTPEALSVLFDMVHEGNRAFDAGETWEAEAGLDLLSDFDRVLAFIRKYHGEAEQKADEEVMKFVEEREKERKAGNWAAADKIRNKLVEMGWELRDTPEGPKVKKKTVK